MAIIKYDTNTGEVFEEFYTKKFWKCYRSDFFGILEVIKNQQLKIFIYICKNVEPGTNKFACTYARMAKETKVSQTTIAKMMKNLKDKDFIRMVVSGLWMLNPNIFVYGSDRNREFLTNIYYSDNILEKFFQAKEQNKNI